MFCWLVDKVIEIIETWRICSTLCWTTMFKLVSDVYLEYTHYVDMGLEAYGKRPSSMGSHTSVMLTELIAVS